jgi:phage regulator Rha-like protein
MIPEIRLLCLHNWRRFSSNRRCHLPLQKHEEFKIMQFKLELIARFMNFPGAMSHQGEIPHSRNRELMSCLSKSKFRKQVYNIIES